MHRRSPLAARFDTVHDGRMTKKQVRIGAIGLGGFARFALQHFIQAPGVTLVCVGGASSEEARHCAARYQADVLATAEEVCRRDDVDWVYINTPPFLHAEQAEMALEHGKNVLVEKPLAVRLEDGRRLSRLADEKGLQLVTNLMQPANPLVAFIKLLIDEQWTGRPLFFNFNNHAVDEGLPTDHWFWDAEKSGGIFVEHGVHFFDLASHWFGPGTVQSAGSHRRTIDGCEDQVWCDVLHADEDRGDVVARFYHGFNQTSRTEAQRWEIVTERAQITMEGWIPMNLRMTAIVSEVETRHLMASANGASCRIIEQYPDDRRSVRGHGRIHEVYQKIDFGFSPAESKSHLYGDLLVAMATRHLSPSSDAQSENSQRGTQNDSSGGLDSLKMAVTAAEMAAAGRRGTTFASTD